jgi:hypothetical protein
MGQSLIAGTIQRHVSRIEKLDRSIKQLDQGLELATGLDRRQSLQRAFAMLVGMPSATVGIVLCTFFFQGWGGMGLWYGMGCLALSSLTLRPCVGHVDSSTRALRERLLDQVYQRQRSQEQLVETMEQSSAVRNPIEVKEEAAA